MMVKYGTSTVPLKVLDQIQKIIPHFPRWKFEISPVCLARNCYIWEPSVMWLLCTQNSIRIGVIWVSSIGNACWDYGGRKSLFIYLFIFIKNIFSTSLLRLCGDHSSWFSTNWNLFYWWRHISNKNRPILPPLTDCLSGGKTAIKSDRDNPFQNKLSRTIFHTQSVGLPA